MSYTKRPLEELNVMDDFLFNVITGDPEVGIPFCRTVLSVFLQRTIKNLRIVTQRTIPALLPGLRGIRMDVEITECEESEEISGPVLNIYDLEPHPPKDVNIARHNRFYQAKIDSRYMSSEENVTNEAIQEIHNYVSRVKVLPEVKQGYMTFEQFLYYEKKEAAEAAAFEERIRAILELLQDLGSIPEGLTDYLRDNASLDELRQWNKLAARADSIQEFQEQIHFETGVKAGEV